MNFTNGNGAELSLKGNEWRSGDNTSGNREVLRLRAAFDESSEIYLINNYSPTRVGVSEWDGVVLYDTEDPQPDSTTYKVSSDFSWAETYYYDYTNLDDSLSADAGARPWDKRKAYGWQTWLNFRDFWM